MGVTEEPLLVARDVYVAFKGAQILAGASLAVHDGTIHVLIGPNGAGKTTLANVITGHVRPDSGDVTLRGERLSGESWRRARRGIGRKFQVPRVFARLTADQNLAIARARARRDGDPTLGQEIGVTDVLGMRAEELGHGWRQRLEMRMVLDQGPVLGVLDEPTAGMPKSERVELASSLTKHRGQMTYLIVEHDMDFVEAVADSVSFMHDGQVTASGTFAEVRADPRVREIYLGETATGGAGVRHGDARKGDFVA